MKKIILLTQALIVCMLLCSCGLKGNTMMPNNDQNIANKTFEEVIQTIQSKNKDGLTALFSPKALREASSFEESTDDLFDYFEGKLVSYDDWGGPYVSSTKEDDYIYQIMESTYDIITTQCEYRFAIQQITKNSADAKSVGVLSLYIIKKEDDINLQYAYYGDGKFTPGINIGIPNAE